MCWVVCLCVQLASGIYSFACSLWSHHTDCFLQQIYARDEAAALGSLERTLLSLKGIRRVHIHPAFSSSQGNNGSTTRSKKLGAAKYGLIIYLSALPSQCFGNWRSTAFKNHSRILKWWWVFIQLWLLQDRLLLCWCQVEKKDSSLPILKGLKAGSALSLVQLKGLSSLALSATKARLPETANLILVDLCRLTRSTILKGCLAFV